jgi:hypothetical protein
MFGHLFKWLKRALIGLVLLVVLLLLPVGYIETFCRADPDQSDYQSIMKDPEYYRAEANSYLTYPEWHIVFAYEGLAKVLKTGDEYELDYFASISSFWQSFCALNTVAGKHGGADFATRATIHTIGVSFTLEMAAKALYEETIGWFAALLRGDKKTFQDIYASQMADDYAQFLLQRPWYQYDFDSAVTELWQQPVINVVRGWERRLALGGEWKAKAAYARVIGQAVAAAGQAKLTIRSVVSGVAPTDLVDIEGIKIVNDDGQQLIIETPRYRKFTRIVEAIIARNGQIVEVAGNDDVMLSATKAAGTPSLALDNGNIISRITRDGYGGSRILVDAKIQNLSLLLSELKTNGYSLEHIYDY